MSNQATQAKGFDMFPNHSTKELFELNTIYFREWEADRSDEGKKLAVIRTGEELTRRGAW